MRLALFALLAIAGFLAFASEPGGGQRAFASSDFPIEGDADCDLSVDQIDALVVAHVFADLDPDAACLDHIDVNCDGIVDMLDMLEILKYYANLELAALPQGCAGVGSAGGLPPVIVNVDETIDVGDETIPGINGGEPRPVAAMVDEEGVMTRFVEDEVIIQTNDIGVLNAFLARWNATEIKSVDPSTLGLLMPIVRLVHIPNLSSIDTSELQADLRAAQGEVWGSWDVSSQDGLGLLALAADEAAGGTPLGLNFILDNHGFMDFDLAENPTGPNSYAGQPWPYDPNPAHWPYMNRGSVQDIGVADAWRALDVYDKLDNDVSIVVMDGGFSPNADFPPGYDMIGPENVENPAKCTAGSDCPWHATMVTAASMGQVNNGFGVAGPAGPVADATLVQSPATDFFEIVDYILLSLPQAAFPLPDIVNISAGAPLASEWCLTGVCHLMDGLTLGLRALDVVIFASAANDNRDVDKIKCVDLVLGEVCYEAHVWIPCEATDVVCVGGLDWNSNRRIVTSSTTGSNWGSDLFSSDTVDIYGPYVQYTTPDPDGGVKLKTCGTSCASPFVAGVAALVKAADPSMSGDELVDTLFAWSHHNGPDFYVRRWVNAYDAVVAVLGNAPPYLEIELADGTYNGGIPFPLSAHLTDDEDLPFEGGWTGLPTIQWTSSIDGPIGNNAPLTTPVLLSYGLHEITATATDSAGATVTDTAIWNIVNPAPTVNITTPADGVNIFQGQQIILRGTSADENSPGGVLTDDQVEWFTAPVGNPGNRTLIGDGHRLRASFLEGTYLLTFKGTDDGNASGEDSITINVGPSPVDFPPTPEITSVDPTFACQPGPSYYYTLNGVADDQEDGNLSGGSLVWTRSVNGGAETFVGTGNSVQMFTSGLTNGDVVRVYLRATDSALNTGVDFFDINHGCFV